MMSLYLFGDHTDHVTITALRVLISLYIASLEELLED